MDLTMFQESAISDSYIYGMFNTSGEVESKIVKGLQSGILLGEEYFQEQFLQFAKLRFSPLFQKVLDNYRSGAIRIMQTPLVRLTKSIPFIVHKDHGRIVATVFISSFASISEEPSRCNIDAKALYTLMEAAYLGIMIQTVKTFKRNTTLMKICNEIYVDMIMRILNRDYALSLDVSLHDRVSYIVSRFFLEKVWECENTEIMVRYATSTMTEKGNQEAINQMETLYTQEKPKDILRMFDVIKSLTPRMEKLSVRYFVERFINTYGGSAILGIDYLPYVTFIISNVLIGGFLVNQTTLNDIIKKSKDITKYYPELMRIIVV